MLKEEIVPVQETQETGKAKEGSNKKIDGKVYSGANDSKLPENIQNLPEDKRKQWVSIWNSRYTKCKEDGRKESDCEGFAFAQANSVVLSEDKNDKEKKTQDTKSEKCEKCENADVKEITAVKTVEPEPDGELESEPVLAKEIVNNDSKNVTEQLPEKQAMPTMNDSEKKEIIDLREKSLPPNLHVSNGSTKCAKCAWFTYANDTCMLHRVLVIPSQTCDNFSKSPYFGMKSANTGIELQENFEPEIKAGMRNSASDMMKIQQIHDTTKVLGANCELKTEQYKGNDKHINSSERLIVSSDNKENILKAVEVTDDHIIARNYLVLFGGRDLEGHVNKNINGDGSKGEYFHKGTMLDSGFTETDNVLVDWEHGNGGDGEPTKYEPIGRVLWGTKKVDEYGVLIDRLLYRRNKFVENVIKPLLEAGYISTSSEAVPGKKVKSSDGAINKWPIMYDSLTMTPMDPRMLNEIGGNQLQAIKSAIESVPRLKEAFEKESIKAAKAQMQMLKKRAEVKINYK